MNDKPDFSIAAWCRKRGWSKSKYRKMRAAGRGPVELRVGHSISITAAADLAWEQRWLNPQGDDLRLLEQEAAARSRAASKAARASLRSPRHGSRRPNRPHVEV